MAQSAALIEQLKRELRSRGLTYADVATAIGMSEASVKRMLSKKDLTLKRLDEICSFAQIDFAELARSRFTQEGLVMRLSEAQERELVSQPLLFLVAACVMNLMTYEQILDTYAMEPAELVRCLVKLDRIRFIRLLPNNRYKLLVARTFSWLPNGPMQNFFKAHAADYFNWKFDGPGEVMLLVNGRLTRAAQAVLVARLQRVAREFAEQHAEDAKEPMQARYPVSLLVAARPWQLSFMRELQEQREAERQGAARPKKPRARLAA